MKMKLVALKAKANLKKLNSKIKVKAKKVGRNI